MPNKYPGRHKWATKTANKQQGYSFWINPNQVSDNRSTQEFLKDRNTSYKMALNDFDASKKNDAELNRSSMPQTGAHFRSILNSYSTTSNWEKKFNTKNK